MGLLLVVDEPAAGDHDAEQFPSHLPLVLRDRICNWFGGEAPVHRLSGAAPDNDGSCRIRPVSPSQRWSENQRPAE